MVIGPVSWPDPSVRQALYIAGFSESPAGLHAPDGSALAPLPGTEPTTGLTLADGYAILPVTSEPSSPPAGQVEINTSTVIANGAVTVSPVYGPAPVIPAPTLAQAQAQVCAAIEASMNAALYTTFTDSSGNTWDVSQTGRALLTGASAEIANGLVLPANFAWKNAANVPLPMTVTAFKALTQAIFTWTNNVFGAAMAASAAVSAMTDPAAVLAYQIPAWPTS
jgi:hypothetical protein